MGLKRSIGFVGLTFISVGGIIGSGWIFGPLLTSQLAGPASILSWIIGGFAMLVLALIFAEISSLFPIAGGVATLPLLSLGRTSAALLGWMAWLGYATSASIETLAALDYLSHFFHWIKEASDPMGDLTLAGKLLAGLILFVFVLINAIGVHFFTRFNTALTWLKIAIPLTIAIALLTIDFNPNNFDAYGGPMPYGWTGVFSAISTGGIIFSFIGFRHAIDMAEEVERPERTIPMALIAAILLSMALYTLLQVAFIGALDPNHLASGWEHIHFEGQQGPLAALVSAQGISWLTVVLYVGAFAGPFGAALVAASSTSRIVYSLSLARLFPHFFTRLNSHQVPFHALLLNFVVGLGVVFFLTFKEAVAINGATIVLSFSAGAISLLTFRRQFPDKKRLFRLPFAHIFAIVGFGITSLIVYWSGFGAYLFMLGALGIGLVVFLLGNSSEGGTDRRLDLRSALWLIPYLVIMGIVGYTGNFGGQGLLSEFEENMLVFLFSIAILYLALHGSLSPERSAEYYRSQTENKEDDKG
jgi:amino acid transporter